MTLSSAQIVDAAYHVLRNDGLSGLSMRRVAQQLGVQPGALYYHVASKQDLLAAVAEQIFRESDRAISTVDAAQAAGDIRQILLPVRDSADVISFVRAFRPESLVPLQQLPRLFAGRLPDRHARWGAQTLIHYVLGFVAQEQNRAELMHANILTDAAGTAPSDEAFRFGVDAILRGLAAAPPTA